MNLRGSNNNIRAQGQIGRGGWWGRQQKLLSISACNIMMQQMHQLSTTGWLQSHLHHRLDLCITGLLFASQDRSRSSTERMGGYESKIFHTVAFASQTLHIITQQFGTLFIIYLYVFNYKQLLPLCSLETISIKGAGFARSRLHHRCYKLLRSSVAFRL